MALDPDPVAREQRLLLLVALALPLALLALGRALEPDPRGWGTHEQLGFRPCYPMRQWSVPCPGCGVTTALALTVHGRPLEGLRTQPLGPLGLALGVGAAGWALRQHAKGRSLARELARQDWRRLASALGTLVLLAWLYKLVAVRGGP